MEKNATQKKKFFTMKTVLIVLIALIVLGVGGTAVILKLSDIPEFCTLCHNMQPYYDSWKDGNLLAKKHAEAGLVCHDCHQASLRARAEEGIKFVTGNYKTPLDKREFPKDFCLKCHKDFEAIKAKTDFTGSNPHDSHQGDLECHKCHTMHRPSELVCQKCHNFSWFKDLPDYWVKK